MNATEPKRSQSAAERPCRFAPHNGRRPIRRAVGGAIAVCTRMSADRHAAPARLRLGE